MIDPVHLDRLGRILGMWLWCVYVCVLQTPPQL
jgi:hypothetical protein